MTMDQMKTCNHCDVAKPLTEFYKAKDNRDGRQGTCRECLRAQGRERRRLDGEAARARDRAYYRRNKEARKGYAKRAAETYKELTVPGATKMNNRWEDSEDVFLMADNGLTVVEKSVKLRRTYAACCVRRLRLRDQMVPGEGDNTD